MKKIVLILICSMFPVFSVISFAGETGKSGKQTLVPSPQTRNVKTPLVVIYTLSTCSHCREAKEYLQKNNIPFVNREVDSDEEHMANLMKIYDSMGTPDQNRGVPLFVIDNRIRIQGFNKEKLQGALKDVESKPE